MASAWRQVEQTPLALDKPTYSRGYKAWFILLVFLTMACNYIDRSIIRVLSQPIKTEFHLSDFQIGVLGGLSFALCFTPSWAFRSARLADKRSRVNIITVAMAAWSLLTGLCGLAQSYAQLLLFRVGVGVGEAGVTPPVFSLISDYFPANRRASALAFYSFGVGMGGMAGAIIGGATASAWGWRGAFAVVGLPGLLLAVLFKLTVKEPARGQSDPHGLARGGLDEVRTPSILAVAKRMLSQPTLVHIVIGSAVANFAIQGINTFDIAYLLRRFHVGLAEVGLITGVLGGSATCAGMVLGGFLTDWAGKHDQRWYFWAPAIGLALAAPLYIVGFLQSSFLATVGLVAPIGLVLYIYHAPGHAVAQNLSQPKMRSTVAALQTLCSALIGLGLAPAAVGWISDRLAVRAFAGQGQGSFALSCPGGTAALGASDHIRRACLSASATGVQQAMIGCAAMFLWAALHYLLAARHAARDYALAEAGG